MAVRRCSGSRGSALANHEVVAKRHLLHDTVRVFILVNLVFS